jgi:transcription initiation factor IIF auxiliary subunit
MGRIIKLRSRSLPTDGLEHEQRKVKLVTEQEILPDREPEEGFPIRKWSVRLYVLDEQGDEHPATCFQKVVFNLHPSFPQPTKTFHKPPFKCEEEGWGEFEMLVDCYITEKQKQSISHDLSFAQSRYENVHTVSFKNPSQALQQILRETGSLPDDKKKSGTSKKPSQKYDLEKIAEALEKLEEEDLLRVIQLIQDHKTAETYIKSDVDAGEFSIDLFTMSETLTKALWDYLGKKGLVA